jgi:hypothetical protein
MLFTCSNLPHQYIFSTLKITLYTEYKTFKCHTSKQAMFSALNSTTGSNAIFSVLPKRQTRLNAR